VTIIMAKEIKKSITIEQAIEVLNEAFKLDARTIQWLINNRVPCNAELAGHPTIQVKAIQRRHIYGGEPVRYEIGLLGIINGLFGVNENESGYIAAEFDDDGKLIGFKSLEGAE